MKINLNKSIFGGLATLAALGFIIILSIYIRTSTLSSPTVLDYDPWWFYRHAKEIVDNGYNIPSWDTLSYYPPGRPYSIYQGWPFTIAYLYKALNSFMSIDLMNVAKISPIIMVALTTIPAFLLGRMLSNNIGGLLTALFAVVSPSFIVVSMGGYVDTDVVVNFYLFLSLLAIVTTIKFSKNLFLSIPLYTLSVISVLLFAFNWSAGWLPLILFTAFIPAFIIFRIIEDIIHQQRFKVHWKNLLPDIKSIVAPIFIILLITNVLGFILLQRTMIQSFIGGLTFTGLGGEPLIVNISVAELQAVNIFTKEGFLSVANRVGMLPTIMTLLGLPLLVVYKIFRRERINFMEVFLFMWAVMSFYLILKGTRFQLLFSTAAALSGGYVIGNLFNYLKSRNALLFATTFAVIGAMVFVSISTAMQIGQSSSDLVISQNWYNALEWLKSNADNNALVATWWDPGHIIAGYTGLKVHADGAHCWYGDCIPYDHNIRIRDMGRMMSTDNETESLEIIKKYTHLTDDQCDLARQTNGNKMPEDACKDVSEVYIMATNDLIGKYYWMSCFGTFDMNLWKSTGGKQWECDGKNYQIIPLSALDRSVYQNSEVTISLLQNDTQILAVLNAPRYGVRNALVRDIVYFQAGQEIRISKTDNNTLDAMVWVDPSFRSVIFMDASIRDSVYTNMFFFQGRDLKNFELMYSNSEVKIFKAKLQ
ncbi:MAG: hypothetical protein HYT70_00790 [Candidatus Aenigmarchaeota archaeon]|nr:hypothetical protein [Candidatus Aenigmarchaeota archaeon]